jgi:glycosyltransferase involved in cell wall biosynthesis
VSGPAARRRVVAYTAADSRGGAEVSLRNLLAALDPAYEVVVMGIDETLCRWVASVRPGTAVELVPPIRSKAGIGAMAAHRKAITRLDPDVFQASLRSMADARWAVLAAVTVRSVATIAVEQLPLAPTERLTIWLKRATSRRLAAHVAVGERAARIVEESVGLSPGSVRTIYNGVPDGPTRAQGDPATRGSARVVVGSLARLDEIKGLDVLLDAVAPLDTVDVVLVGEGPERGALDAQARRLGLGDRLRFEPWSDDARALLPSFDVFVLPSRNEGFPLSILEAMLAGIPVVATDVGSVAEAVVGGRTGLVVAPDDAAGLRAALAELVADPERRAAMGAAGRADALERFTAATMARQYEALYDEVTKRHEK